MISVPANASSVHDLQARAEREARRRVRSQPLSRAARLYLISDLSRRSGAGLAVIGGMIACLAILSSLAVPARALIWAAMAAPALYVARRLQQSYLVGGKASPRPFHWRADYVAALCVLGAAFGSGAMLLATGETSLLLSASLGAAIMVAGLAAALGHASHGPAAAALWSPAVAFSLFAALRGGGGVPLVSVLAIGVLGAFLIAYAVRRERAKARDRFPLSRRQPKVDPSADETDAVDLDTAAGDATGTTG